MPTVTTKDGVEIFYKDWGYGQPIVFSHGWPLSADDWDNQMLFFMGKGFRVIAHDRRGHGRSTQVADGHDMDHYADDLFAVTSHLDLRTPFTSAIRPAAAKSCITSPVTAGSVAKAAIISAVPPLMVRRRPTRAACQKGVRLTSRRSSPPTARGSIATSPLGPSTTTIGPARSPEATIQNWWRQGMMGGAKAHYDGIVAFSQTDFTEDLKKITIPVLVMHWKTTRSFLTSDAGPLSAKLLKNGTLKTYKGFPHGMPTTQAETINADLLAFIKG